MGQKMIPPPGTWARLVWVSKDFRSLWFLFAILGVLSLLSGCASPRAIISDPRSVWCEQNSPRRDATPTTPRWVIDEINAHNAKGVDWCGWRP